ncbi:doublecortin domain-containing protein 2-like isoform X1 [Scleropages formosus]|uniref:doublecortin domain-containing protein 2-like isoform X1 n=1 Tax=Scleropages formosus TaxID=113540 RepID=UPI0010FA9162|nr:doublecortin domain-containing protein 2 isoform X1 [Scleropages formosus]
MDPGKPSFLAQPVVKNIFVYRNGDPFYEGRRLVINEKRVSSFETFLKEVTGGVQAPFGAVRNIYTPGGGHRVSSMEHIRSGERYVAAGRERFKKLDYSQIGSKKKGLHQNTSGQVKRVPHGRVIASARFLKPIKEPCLIFVVANGDVLNPAVRLLIPQRTLGQFERVLEMITEKMSLRVLGGVHSLYTFNGTLISDGKELENGQFYVAVGREKFKKLPYSDLIFAKPAMRRFIGSKASLPPIYGIKKQNDTGRHQSKSMAGCNVSKASPTTQGSKEARSEEQLMMLRPKKSGLTMSFGAQDVEDGGQGDDESSADRDTQLEEGWNGQLPIEQNQTEEDGLEETTEGDKVGEEEISQEGRSNLLSVANGIKVQDSPEAKGNEEKSEEDDDAPSSSVDGKLENTEETADGSGLEDNSDNVLSDEKQEVIWGSSQEEAELNGLEERSEDEEEDRSLEDADGGEGGTQHAEGETGEN